MAVAAGEVEIARDRDGLVAVRRDVVVDPERGVVAEVERTVVAVEDSEGNVAVMQQNRVRAVGIADQAPPTNMPRPPAPVPPAARVDPPRRASPRTQQASSHSRRAPRHPQQHRTVTDRTPLINDTSSHRRRRKGNSIQLSGCLLCSLLYIVCGGTLIGLGIKLVWPCDPLEKAAISIVVFGAIAVSVGCTCCCYVRKVRGHLAIFLCIVVGVLLLLALAAAATESSYGLANINDYIFTRNGSRIDGCRYDDNTLLPVSLVIVSYVFLCLTFLYFAGSCINAVTSSDENPCLYK